MNSCKNIEGIDIAMDKGSIDGIWGYDLKIWDIEAGICLIREAQGKVLEKKIGTNKTIIAGNSYVVKLLKNNLN